MQAKSKPFYYDIIRAIYTYGEQASILVSGKRGSGKSTLCLKILWDLDPSVHKMDTKEIMLKRVCKNIEQFFGLLDSLRTGNVVIIEEAGVNASHRDYMTRSNKSLQEILQIIRYKKIILIFNSPTRRFVDKAVRSMFDYRILTKPGIDRVRQINECRVSEVLVSDYYERDYDRFFRVIVDGTIFLRGHEFWERPPKALEEEYLRYSKEYKDAMIESRRRTAQTMREIAASGGPNAQRPMPKFMESMQLVKDNLDRFKTNRKNPETIATGELMLQFSQLSHTQIALLKRRMEQQLYDEGILSVGTSPIGRKKQVTQA